MKRTKKLTAVAAVAAVASSLLPTWIAASAQTDNTLFTEDFESYDMVLIGFPIWYGGAPSVVRTFCKGYDFSGKKVAVFATSGGSGIDRAVKDLKKQYPDLDIIGGKLLNGKVTGDIA